MKIDNKAKRLQAKLKSVGFEDVNIGYSAVGLMGAGWFGGVLFTIVAREDEGWKVKAYRRN